MILVYLHGFRSSPASAKARQLAAAVESLPVKGRPTLVVPALPHRPARALDAIDAIVAGHGDEHLCLVGSSLGGFYATVAAERHGRGAVLINPAVRPDVALRDHAGPQMNMHTGERFDVTPSHFDELAAMRVERITRPERYFLLAQTGDEILDYRAALRFYAGACQFIQSGGSHAYEGFDAQTPAIFAFAGVADPQTPPRLLRCT
ncbi:MAG: YqiA/YcfP family alpha/beta fold hydrolase [Betaproteobacteria bacterium]